MFIKEIMFKAGNYFKAIFCKFHRKRCKTCKYYTINKMTTECAFNGRTLSVRCGDNCADDARYCSAWASNMPSNDTFHNTNVPDIEFLIKKGGKKCIFL